MNTQRITIGLLWIVSLLAAYFIGGTGRSGQPAPSADSPASKSASERDDSPGRQLHAAVRKLEASESEGTRGETADIAKSVTDPKLRLQSIGQIYEAWKPRDAAAADAALNASGLSPEAIQALRKVIIPPAEPTGRPAP